MKQIFVLLLLLGITVLAARCLAPDPSTSAQLYSRALQAEGQGHFEKATHWYRKAAQRGSTQAQYAYGYLLWQERDFSGAYYWLSLAAEEGQPEAQALLATMYQNGHGVSPNFDEAVAWFRTAASNGDSFAKRNLTLLHDQGML